MKTQTKASFRIAVIMTVFLGLAAALSLALGSSVDNVWVPAGQGERHDEVSAVHTAAAQDAEPHGSAITRKRDVIVRSHTSRSAPTALDAQRQLI